MTLLAQAVAEYGSLSSGASGAANSLLSRISNAGTEEYVLAGVVICVAMYLLMKLLDAA